MEIFENPPSDAFDNADYRTLTKVISENINNTLSRRSIEVKIWATLKLDSFDGINDIAKFFFDSLFYRWKEFEFGDNLEILELRVLQDTSYKYGRFCRAYSRYDVKAPSPIYRQPVEEISSFWEDHPINGAHKTVRFGCDTDYLICPPGMKKTTGSIDGFLEKKGTINIRTEEENNRYLVYSAFTICPELQILPDTAAPYIKNVAELLLKRDL